MACLFCAQGGGLQVHVLQDSTVSRVCQLHVLGQGFTVLLEDTLLTLVEMAGSVLPLL